MDVKQTSQIADISLAEAGKLKIDWVRAHMPVLNQIRAQYEKTKPFEGLQVSISLHLEAKTAYLAQVIQAGGADVTITGSNPLSTQDDVCAALVESGVQVFARYNPDPEEYKQHLYYALEGKPDLLIDDGGDLVTILHDEKPEWMENVRGGAEETTTGILRLQALANSGQLKFPMMAVNDARCKHLFDNRYGTGQSVWDGINRTTNLIVAGKTVVVIGYGWCGRGVARRAEGLGAKVIVTEIDPVKAIEAYMDGYHVMSMDEAAAHGDYFVSVTGNRDCIKGTHYEKMKDGAILANAGHFDVEINLEELGQRTTSKRIVRQNIEEYTLQNGRRVYVLAEGRLVNLAAGDGHPAEIMDMTFALQALALEHVNKQHKQFENTVVSVPPSMDQQVAELKLQALGIQIDSLSNEQDAYLTSWKV